MGIVATIRRLFSRPQQVVEQPTRAIRGRYDAAQTTDDNSQHWSATDAYSADAANSLAVRTTLMQRSRYETENNGNAKGVILTHAAYIVGRGPKLRMRTKSQGFNAMIEARWQSWCKATKFGRKLPTALKAKTRDGEGILIARNNPNVADAVKLDLVGIEAEQMQSPGLMASENRVDGVWFDDFGNPTAYDVLKYHPGGNTWSAIWKAEKIPAKFVFHAFREDRPGQHRAVPEISATLGLFAQNRRFREATVAAAETAADFALILKQMAGAFDGSDPIRPFSTIPLEKRMATAAPEGWEPYQLKAEHPTTTYGDFTKLLSAEEARPLSMPQNIARCDSSGYSFSGGKLDHLTYFVAVEVDQADLEDCICDPLFSLWFAEAAGVYGWSTIVDPITDELVIPPHDWAWPPRPKIDDTKTATARQTDLSTGVASPSEIATEDGYDWEDRLQTLATDYGVTVEEIQKALFSKHLLESKSGAAPATQEEPPPPDDENADDEGDSPPTSATANGNGHRRFIYG
jgi:capsid protein